MKATFESGRWTWSAPIGYVSAQKPLQCLQIDPIRGPMIVKLFEMIAEGQIKKSSALAQVSRLGLRTVRGKELNQETVSRLLTNELYCGRMVAKAWNLRVKGDFTPLVSEELFDRVQDVLSGRAVATTPHKRQNEAFPMRGSLRCNVCNALVTGAKSTGKVGLRFPEGSVERERYRYRFYRCYRAAGHFSQRAETVEAALNALLLRMEPSGERLKAVVGLFRHIWKERVETAQVEVNAMKAQLKKLETKEAKFLSLVGDGVITNAAYKRATDSILPEIEGIRQELASQKFDELDVDDAAAYLEAMYWNLPILYESSNLEGKSSLLKMLFPDGVVFDSGVLEPKSTNSFFTTLGDVAADESVLASPMGFEPMLSP